MYKVYWAGGGHGYVVETAQGHKYYNHPSKVDAENWAKTYLTDKEKGLI